MLTEIALPENVTYQSGDYLSVLPSNPPESVRRVISRFALLADQQVSAFWQVRLWQHYELTRPTDHNQVDSPDNSSYKCAY